MIIRHYRNNETEFLTELVQDVVRMQLKGYFIFRYWFYKNQKNSVVKINLKDFWTVYCTFYRRV